MNQELRRRSWSQYTGYRQCPKQFELSRLRRVPKRPGVWLSAGVAVHENIEEYLWNDLHAKGIA